MGVKKTPDYVSVVGAVLRKNRKAGADDPAVVRRRGRSGKPQRAKVVEVLDADGRVAAVVEQRPDRPLGCGAVVYVTCFYGTRAKRVQPAASAAQSTRGRGGCPTGSAP